MNKKALTSATDFVNSAKWYIITAISGNEDSVVKNLKSKITSYGFSNSVEDIRIIKEKNITIEEFTSDKAPSNVGRNTKNIQWKTIEKNGKTLYQKIKSENRNKFGGYIFIKMYMDDKIWYIIRNTQLVTGIIGSSGKNTKPIPVSDFEIERILNYQNYNIDDIKDINENVSDIYKEDDAIVMETTTYEADFGLNDTVKVISGDMVGESGKVISMNDSKGIATVAIEIFSRIYNVEIAYSNLEKID